MGFSIRLAPGVRIRASSRGVRTSLGPRVARVHVGGGRTGFSTGVGPVTYYTSGSRARRRTSSSRRAGSATAQRQLAAANRAAEKAEHARALLNALDAILNLHREEFPPAQRPVAPAPPAVDASAFRGTYVKQAKASTSLFARAERKAALAEAERRALADASALSAKYEQEHAAWRATLDQEWAALNANDPDEVLTTLVDAFEDNEAAAAAVGVEGAEVSLVVLVPPASAVPERQPTTTTAGNLSLRKLTKRETCDLYKLLVCGHALVTVKEAFAVAPGLTSARVVAVRATSPDAYGKVLAEVVLAARFERAALTGILWSQANAVQVVNDASTERIFIQKGAAQELLPVDLSKEPQLAEVVGAVDFEELI